MDVRQLQALVAVAEHGTFSGAAKALHTVQSNISAHVARLQREPGAPPAAPHSPPAKANTPPHAPRLERELGVILVARQSGRLTAEGAAVVARARRVQA